VTGLWWMVVVVGVDGGWVFGDGLVAGVREVIFWVVVCLGLMGSFSLWFAWG